LLVVRMLSILAQVHSNVIYELYVDSVWIKGNTSSFQAESEQNNFEIKITLK
jgi:hypothetical protein